MHTSIVNKLFVLFKWTILDEQGFACMGMFTQLWHKSAACNFIKKIQWCNYNYFLKYVLINIWKLYC